METILNAVRYKVSADKNRYLEGQYDLDLTYITDRVIGMFISHNNRIITSNVIFYSDGFSSRRRRKHL
jgi:hypothetical protein